MKNESENYYEVAWDNQQQLTQYDYYYAKDEAGAESQLESEYGDEIDLVLKVEECNPPKGMQIALGPQPELRGGPIYFGDEELPPDIREEDHGIPSGGNCAGLMLIFIISSASIVKLALSIIESLC